MKRLSVLALASALSWTASCSSGSGGSPGGSAGSTGAGGSGTAGSNGASGSSGAGGGRGNGTAGESGTAGSSGAGAASGNGAVDAGGSTPVTPGSTGPMGGALTSSNSVWGPGDITLTSDVTVPAGITLTINPGTRVNGAFAITASGGTFECRGTLATPASIFAGSINLVGGTHSIKYCILNSSAAVAIDVSGATLNASHLQIQKFTSTGIDVHGATGKIAVDFSTIGSAAKLFTGDTVAEEGVSVLIAAEAGNNKSSITNSVLGFLNNLTNTGLKIMGPSNTHLAYDNITGSASTLTTSDAPVGILRGDPNITDIPNFDHNLAFFSADLDQADPAADFSQEPAPNGGRANLGYHGGTSQARITTVQVVTPNGCEELKAGAATPITWHSSPNTGPKTIQLSTDGGATWAKLAAVAAGADTGTAMATFPAGTKTDQAMIQFSQDNDPTHIVDASDNVFAIGMPKNANACMYKRPLCATNCKPFTVICYTGYRDGQMPTGAPGANEPTHAQVLEDLTILSKYTHGIRTYGSNPLLHDGKEVPGIADQLGLTLHMGTWIDDTYTDDQNTKAIDDSLAIIAAGHTSIKTLIVGNEYMLRVRQSNGNTSAAEKRLVGYIKYARSRAPQTIEVVTGESYPDWLSASAALWNAVDRVMWHVHPWWEQVVIADAANHVADAHNKMLQRMKDLGVTKPERLAETGYPWGQCSGPACGSEANQAQYLHDLNQYSLQSGLEYWFFEAFDEAWKGAEGGVGAKWGMWTSARQKHLIITDLDNGTLIPTAEGWSK